jgi:hypothetical protein
LSIPAFGARIARKKLKTAHSRENPVKRNNQNLNLILGQTQNLPAEASIENGQSLMMQVENL